MIEVSFACGHRLDMETAGGAPPICPQCSERRVAHVKAPAPRFRGIVTGPCAQFEMVAAYAAPLKVKE